MKNSIYQRRLFLSLFTLVLLAAQTVSAQTTEFTYQGRLTDNSMAANGNYDFTFQLFSNLSGGSGLLSLTRTNVPVSNGAFTVVLDYGATYFNGADLYLEISVKPSGSPNPYTTLAPRQKITSAPYSIRSSNTATADNALKLGGVAASNYLQANGDGSNLTNLNASNITTGTLSDAQLSSNVALHGPNTFTGTQTINGSLTQTGTTANLTLTNGFVATGSFNPFSGAIPATGAGTRMMYYPRKAAFRVGNVFGTQWDDANIGNFSVAMGNNTTAIGDSSTAIGNGTTASNSSATALGYLTLASGNSSTAIGYQTTASGLYSTALGNSTTASNTGTTALGSNTTANGANSTALGNSASTGNQTGSFVYGDASTSSIVSSIVPNEFVVRASGGFRFRTASDLSSGCTITSGNLSCTGSISGTLTGNGSGLTNLNASNIKSGTLSDSLLSSNIARRDTDNIFTGLQAINGNLYQLGTMTTLNLTNGFVASGTLGSGTLPATGGGTRMMFYPNKAAFRAGEVTGTQWDDIVIGIHSIATGYNTTASGDYSTAMGTNTTASGTGSTAMGGGTTASGINSTAMGNGTTASGVNSIAIGTNTAANGNYSTTMGYFSGASGNYSTAMGYSSGAGGDYSTAMGKSTTAGGDYSTAMGIATHANGEGSTAMGYLTTAGGNYSTAMGYYASTNTQGSFVYGDNSTNNFVTADAPYSWTIRAAGGYRFFTSSDLSTGVSLSAGGGAWNTISDRNAKDNIMAINPRDVLRGVLKLPISTWNYKGQSQFLHIGPMAQDFYSIFKVGESDKTITTVDPDGVALAAIQGLNEELQDRDVKIKRLEQQVKQQQVLLNGLRKLVCQQNPQAEVCK